MQDERIARLEARLRALESEARRGRRGPYWGALALFVVSLAAGAAVLGRAQALAPRSIEAKEFVIRDEAGRTVFYVGWEQDEVVLFLRDSQGRVTARLPYVTTVMPLEGR